MCVAAIAWDAHPDWLLVAVGNRDELHERPAAALARWDDAEGVIAGRDLQAGGTWLGVSEAGRFALVTNYSVPEGARPGRPSRGALVTDMLSGLQPEGTTAMNPFNLIYADLMGARFLTNHLGETDEVLAPGVYGVSNGAFETPWPKTRQLHGALVHWLHSAETGFDPLFAAMRAETPRPDAQLGSDDPESVFAPVFIRHPLYGTRCSTVVAIRRDGAGQIMERSFTPDGVQSGEQTFAFRWG